MPHLFSSIERYVDSLDPYAVPLNRRNKLQLLVDRIGTTSDNRTNRVVNFICTHNARRSQYSQIWATSLAYLHNIGPVRFVSGGTEVTCVHPMVISALRNAGFIIEVNNKNKENPVYTVSFSEQMDPILCYSKKYDDSFDADQMYVAVLNCPQAEATCPYIPPPVEKIALPYDDPAKYDSEQNALEAYKIACRQVATEMLWVMKKISGS